MTSVSLLKEKQTRRRRSEKYVDALLLLMCMSLVLIIFTSNTGMLCLDTEESRNGPLNQFVDLRPGLGNPLLPAYNGTDSLPPAGREPVYAMVTMVLTKEYMESAMSMCASVRKGFNNALPEDIELVAFVTHAEERGVDVGWLSCCYTHVVDLPVITVSKPAAYYLFKEQYTKLHLWNQVRYKRIVYFDADFAIVRVQPIVDILKHSTIQFGAVQDWFFGEWAQHWNGGMILLEPNQDLYLHLVTNVEPYINEGRFNIEMAEQGYVSAFFDHLGFTFPTTYNLNIAMWVHKRELWDQYIDSAVAIHYTVRKPWLLEERHFPLSLWWENLEYAQTLCPRREG